jgi:dihydrofolate reductase
MRKVILGAAITLDGLIARPDGSVDYLVMTKEAAALMTNFFATVDTIVMGRKTLEVAAALSGGSYKSPVKAPPMSSRVHNLRASVKGSSSRTSRPLFGCAKFARARANTSSIWVAASWRAAFSKRI